MFTIIRWSVPLLTHMRTVSPRLDLPFVPWGAPPLGHMPSAGSVSVFLSFSGSCLR